MAKHKVLLICASSCLLLSLFIGLISGVSFGIVILRAIVVGLFTFSGGMAINFLLKKFVPELFVEGQKTVSADVDPALGNAVDITFDDEEDIPIGMPSESLKVDTTPLSVNISSPQQDSTQDNDSAMSFEENSQDLTDSFEKEINSSPPSPSPVSEASKGSETSETVEAPSPTEERDVVSEKKIENQEEVLEALPNLEEFVPASSLVENEHGSEDFTEAGTGGSFNSSDMKATVPEADMMVKAIKTILTRES